MRIYQNIDVIDIDEPITYLAPVQPPAVERLTRVGLTQYEARAYVALVRRDGSTPAEVAQVAGVPRPRIYDVLDSLIARGLATQRNPGRAAKYLAVAPAEAMARLVQAHRQQLDQLEAHAKAAADELGPAYQEGSRHSDPLDYIEVIHDRDLLTKRYEQLQSSVQRELLAFSKGPSYAVEVDKNRGGLELAGQRVVRCVYELSVLEDPTRRMGVLRFLAAGEEARFVEELPAKLVIIDEKKVLLEMPDPVAGKDDVTSIVIEHPHLARILKIAFEHVWQTGMTIDDAERLVGHVADRQ